jgi:hypothetical protein
MKNRILKILGVAVTLAMVLSLAVGFVSAPAASASPGETLNEWYKFDYPASGEDGGWLYDPSIRADGKITQAIDGTLYVSVARNLPDAIFDATSGTITITEFPVDTETGTITADIDGTWNGPETDFVACLWLSDSYDWYGTACVRGTITATNLSFQGSIEALSSGLLEDGLPSPTATYDVTDGSLLVNDGGFDINSSSWWNGVWEGTGGLGDIFNFYGFTDIASALFKSDDGGRSWEETDYPGGWVVDMAASSIDADTLYVTDGHYVYKTDDAGDTWDFVAKDSLEKALAGDCGIPPSCCLCMGGSPPCCPACENWFAIQFTCPITSIDVGYDADDNPFVFIGTRQHVSGVDLNDDGNLDCFPGNVYYIGEAGYPANWTSLNLPCYGGGGYDALAVGCAPNWADTHETYVVVSNGADTDTHVIYTKGTVCGWYEFAELKWNCLNSFGSVFASRIGFPDDWADSETLFVGVVDCAACSGGHGGDVYRVMQDSAVDLNVAGITTGCVGKYPVDIWSLDVKGDADEASLIAGAFCCPEVYYSTDGGWSWDECDKEPTGGGGPAPGATPFTLTSVIFYEDTALAATIGTECAVSMSCGEEVGQYWNQISLIATDIDCVRWGDFSPGYLSTDSHTMYMLTYWDIPGDPGKACFDCQQECYDSTESLFRYDGTNWERVFCSTIAGSDSYEDYDSDIFEWVEVSPDFLTTNCVYLGNEYGEAWRTTDAGCSWDKLTFPCSPRPCISAAVVIDEDTVIAGAGCFGDDDCANNCGYVYKTTRHGSRPWDKYQYNDTSTVGSVVSFALEPGYTDPGSVLLGDDESQVWISEDGGETWDQVGDLATLVGNNCDSTWVIFDPGYATNHTIYATAGSHIARCIIDPTLDWSDQEWKDIGYDYCGVPIDLEEASGIAVAGDTALYVADNSPVGPRCGAYRSLNPTETDETDVVFENLVEGLGKTELNALAGLTLTVDKSDEGCAENVLWSLDSAHCENVWVYEDTLAQPVVLNMPVNEQKLTKTDEATLSWKALCDADCYEVSLYAYCPECPDQKLEVSIPCTGDCCLEEIEEETEADECTPTCTTGETCIVVDDLEPGTTYYWQVRVCQGKPTLSKWSEERSFTTAMMAVPFVDLCSPACGSQDIILTPNFAWGAVEGATGYDVQLSTTETFTAGVVKGKTEVNAWVCPTTLDYATTYYWRVRAVKDTIYSDWTYCMFTTMAEPVPPTPPVVVEQVPPSAPPVINIPPAKMITPTWIYAIIGVGAALAIVVIVLIVRTRRPGA